MLNQLETTCEFEMSSKLRERLVNEAQRAASRKERIDSHARQRIPGDHRRKLRDETVLSSMRFADILDRLEYARL
jgi:hypothetical protein